MTRALPVLAAALLSALACGPARADPPPASPLPRAGTCPSRYSVSGAYCNPGAGAAYALPRPRGATCASGYSVSGDYCLAGAGARLAVPRAGTCPSGFGVSGDFCLSHR